MHCSLQESVGASRGILVLLLNAEGVVQLWHADTHAILGVSHEELKDVTMCLNGPQRGLIHRVGEATRARHPEGTPSSCSDGHLQVAYSADTTRVVYAGVIGSAVAVLVLTSLAGENDVRHA